MTVDINSVNQMIILTNHIKEVSTWYKHVQSKGSITEIKEKNKIIKEWCQTHLKSKWYNYFNIWYFKNESDYLLFLLRWNC